MLNGRRCGRRADDNRRRSRGGAGITILELLVVVATIGILMSILMPAVQAARESARNVRCANNLHQIGVALHSYHDIRRQLPPGWQPEATNKSSYGWAVQTLSQLEESSLDAQIDRRRPIDTVSPAVRACTPEVFLCSSDPSESEFPLFAELGEHGMSNQQSTNVLVTLPHASYIGVFGMTDPDAVPGESGGGCFVKGRGLRFAEMCSGLGYVMMVGERTTRKLASTWLGIATEGEDAPGRLVGCADQGPNLDEADECEFDSRHPGHVNFVWADGHVSSVDNDIDRQLYKQSAMIRY